MDRISKFEKVSYEQFEKDWLSFEAENKIALPESCIKEIYDNIKLPRRATSGSAGYDFYTPIGFNLNMRETIKIPTGIRCRMDTGWVLKCYPRSGLGFKYCEMLANTVGIIDEDFYYSDNEGHIHIKILNNGNNSFSVEEGKGFCQGIFVPFGITVDDDVETKRNGGWGSTDKK